VLRSTNPKHFELPPNDLGAQFRTRTLFHCPGLKTKEGANVFYMRPSRYFAKDETPVSMVIDNLVFVMDKMLQKDADKEIAFIANMEG
jgi:hypothetical protein